MPGAGNLPGDEVINWIGTIRALLPGGNGADGQINCDGVGNCTIRVQWDDSRGGGGATDFFDFTSQI